jgi:hypothetical protein
LRKFDTSTLCGFPEPDIPGFVVGAREDYRKEFRSVRFVLFVSGWVVINVVVVVVILGAVGWLYLIPALLLEQFLFYMTAY